LNIYRNFDEAGHIRNAVVTTGSFDGVHAGHKVILSSLKKLAEETDGETVVITFDPHPRKVLYPDTAGKELYLINSNREKTELLREAGLDNLIIINFTLEFSKISSIDFVRDILLNKIHARKIVIGFNHHFGHNREGDNEALRKLGIQYGFEVEEIPEQDIQHEAVSSAAIRDALLAGDIQKANMYLDHPYIIMGMIRQIDPERKSAGEHGFSLQIEEESKLLPADGTYPVSLVQEDKMYKGSCRIQKHGTSSLEAAIDLDIPDTPADLTGKIVTISFTKKAQ